MATQHVSVDHPTRARHLWASRSGPLAMLVILGGALALLASSVWSVVHEGRSSEIPMVLAYAFWSLLVARIIAVHVVTAGPSGVVLRAPLRTHRLGWDEIACITASPHRSLLRRPLLALTVEGTDGSRLVMTELLDKPGGRHLAELVERLNGMRPAA